MKYRFCRVYIILNKYATKGLILLTAEIGILNNIGVALAADSAVTVGTHKVFNSADKLFSLSKQHPVGIMIYGAANFMGIPWETIVKIYRKKLPETPFNTLQQYCNDFLKYLTTDVRFNNKKAEEINVERVFTDYLTKLLSDLDNDLRKIFKTRQPKIEEVQSILFGEVDFHSRELCKEEFYTGFDEASIKWFLGKYCSLIKKLINEYINIHIDEETLGLFCVIGACLICKKELYGDVSGIVVAGFGEEEIYPSLYCYEIEGIYNEILKLDKKTESSISVNKPAHIVPFAQQEMVHSFLTGIDPSLRNFTHEVLYYFLNAYPDIVEYVLQGKLNQQQKKLLEEKGEELYNEFKKKFSLVVKNDFIDPIAQIVAALPKEELAAMAEALVNLTSIKRKITNQTETVGGPTDVAVISKGEGFIWIKRKHYFKPELNHQYFQ